LKRSILMLVERNGSSTQTGMVDDPMPLLARSLAHLKREISEKKWQEAKAWADLRVTGKKYQYCRRRKVRQKPDLAPAKSNDRLAARSYQLKTGHCLTGQYLKRTKSRADCG